MSMMTDYQRLKEMQDIIGKLHEDEKDNCPPDPEVPFLEGEEIIRSHYHEEIEEKVKTFGLLYNHVTRLIKSFECSTLPPVISCTVRHAEILAAEEAAKDIPRHHPKVAYD